MCFHNAAIGYEGSNALRERNGSWQKVISTLDDLCGVNFVSGCTPVFRRQLVVDLPAWFDEVMLSDWALYILIARHGHVGYIDRVMGFYRLHRGGWWSSRDTAEKLALIISFYAALEDRLGEDYREGLRQHREKAAMALRGEQDRSTAVSLHARRSESGDTFGLRFLETIDAAVPADERIAIAARGDAALIACAPRPAESYPLELDNGAVVSLSTDRTGTMQIPWIAEGTVYDFQLAKDSSTVAEVFPAVSVARGHEYQRPLSRILTDRCQLLAEPAIVPSGPEWGETTICWSSPETETFQLFCRSRAISPLLPDSDDSAIEAVRSLVRAGIRYIAFPQTTFAWLSSMKSLSKLFDESAEVVASNDDCRIYRVDSNSE
jgi:hypothetical protein